VERAEQPPRVGRVARPVAVQIQRNSPGRPPTGRGSAGRNSDRPAAEDQRRAGSGPTVRLAERERRSAPTINKQAGPAESADSLDRQDGDRHAGGLSGRKYDRATRPPRQGGRMTTLSDYPRVKAPPKTMRTAGRGVAEEAPDRRGPAADAGGDQVRVKTEGCGVYASNIPPWEGREWFSDEPRRHPRAPRSLRTVRPVDPRSRLQRLCPRPRRHAQPARDLGRCRRLRR